MFRCPGYLLAIPHKYLTFLSARARSQREAAHPEDWILVKVSVMVLLGVGKEGGCVTCVIGQGDEWPLAELELGTRKGDWKDE